MNFPDSLIEAVARRRAVVVLGAGSSRHANPVNGSNLPPTWRDFLENSSDLMSNNLKRSAKNLIKAGEYLSACEIIKTGLGNSWTTAVENAFGNSRLNYGDLHSHIFSLDLPIVITTNFDRVYDMAAIQLSEGTVRVKTYRDDDLALMAKGGISSRYVFKVHGTIDDISTLIFTRSDYVKLRHKFPLFQNIINSLVVTNTFIFVGCGMTDPDFILLLENMALLSGNYSHHYCIIDSNNNKNMDELYKKCYGLELIRYRYDEKHSELVNMISNLSSQVGRRRSEMGLSLLW